MGLGEGWRALAAASVFGLAALTTTGGLATAATTDPEPVSVSEAADALADLRAARSAAEADAEAALARKDDAASRLVVAQDAETAALAVDRTTKRRATDAAETARKATDTETKTRAAARGAEQALSRMTRNAYINSMTNSDLELFASFAADGPEALSAFARRDMAYDNLSDSALVQAQHTVKVAGDARVVAEQARSVYDDAAAEYDAAHDTLIAARRAVQQVATEVKDAERDITAAEAAVAAADAKYDKAQDVYKEALEKSLADGGGAPISSGPAADVVWRMLKAEGFSEESIAGILGNLQQESGVDPTATQAGGPGRGLAQWSMGGRWDNGPDSLLSFASSRGLDPWDARTQVEFMVFEMSNGWGGFDIEMFKDKTDILDATVYFHDVFEGSADSAEFVRAVRGNYALQWYARLS